MLNQLRQGTKGLTSKVLIGLLVLSFAVWGIGGFEGYGAGTVATVGNEDVTVQEFANLYDQAQRVAAQSGQQVQPDQILARLLLTAALDDEARRNGLGISDQRVAAEIAQTPAFHNASGSFDRRLFENLLRGARMNTEDYVADVKSELVRSQLSGSVSAGIKVPQPMIEAIYRFRNEERTISYVTVDETAIELVGEPGPAELQAFFEENAGRFRAPEYREIALLTLDPTEIADPDAVTQEELQAEYDRRRSNFEQPERRRVEQIVFEDAENANEALSEIESGSSFAEVAEARGASVTDHGLKTNAEFLDSAVAEAAFAAEPEAPAAVTEGALQPSIIRVTEVEAGSVTPLSEVEARLRRELATRQAREQVNDLYDQVEDERAGGSTLEETAGKFGLPYRHVEGLAADLTMPDGSRITDLPSERELVREVFDTDVGIENSPIRAGDVWVFYEVVNIEPARDRTLDEVRDEVTAAWTQAQTEERIAARAASLFEALQSGRPLSDIAAEIGATAQTAEGVKRTDTPQGLSGNAVGQAFAGPEGHVANADGQGLGRILLKVDRVIAPAFFAEAPDAEQIRTQLSNALQSDILTTFNAQLRAGRPISVNNAVYQQLTNQLSGQMPVQ